MKMVSILTSARPTDDEEGEQEDDTSDNDSDKPIDCRPDIVGMPVCDFGGSNDNGDSGSANDNGGSGGEGGDENGGGGSLFG
jgi:hypothetical protein